MSLLRFLFGKPSDKPAPKATIAKRPEAARAAPAVLAPDDSTCPYCGIALTPAPSRSRKCPTCRCDIVVRTWDGQRHLLTVAQASEHEIAKKLDGQEKQRQEAVEHFEEFRALHTQALLRYKKSRVVTAVEILSSKAGCQSCRSLNGKRYTIDQALRQMPIPCPSCSYRAEFTPPQNPMGWCRCTWIPVLPDDK